MSRRRPRLPLGIWGEFTVRRSREIESKTVARIVVSEQENARRIHDAAEDFLWIKRAAVDHAAAGRVSPAFCCHINEIFVGQSSVTRSNTSQVFNGCFGSFHRGLPLNSGAPRSGVRLNERLDNTAAGC